MLEKFQMLSVNQMNAQIKLRKLWKAENVDNYPLKFEKKYLKMMADPRDQSPQVI